MALSTSRNVCQEVTGAGNKYAPVNHFNERENHEWSSIIDKACDLVPRHHWAPFMTRRSHRIRSGRYWHRKMTESWNRLAIQSILLIYGHVGRWNSGISDRTQLPSDSTNDSESPCFRVLLNWPGHGYASYCELRHFNLSYLKGWLMSASWAIM